MKTIVCTGGRQYMNYKAVAKILKMLAIDEIHVGDASGLDHIVFILGRKRRGTTVIRYKADWDKFGAAAAGPERNKRMLIAAGPKALVVAFPGGRGTADCVKQAHGMGMLVIRVEDDAY